MRNRNREWVIKAGFARHIGVHATEVELVPAVDQPGDEVPQFTEIRTDVPGRLAEAGVTLIRMGVDFEGLRYPDHKIVVQTFDVMPQLFEQEERNGQS